MIGTQAQLFTDSLSIGECIEDVIKSKKLVDTTALMTLYEQQTKNNDV